MPVLIVDEDFWLSLQRIEAATKAVAERFVEVIEELYRTWRPELPDAEAEARYSTPPQKMGGSRAGTPGVTRGEWIDSIPADV